MFLKFDFSFLSEKKIPSVYLSPAWSDAIYLYFFVCFFFFSCYSCNFYIPDFQNASTDILLVFSSAFPASVLPCTAVFLPLTSMPGIRPLLLLLWSFFLEFLNPHHFVLYHCRYSLNLTTHRHLFSSIKPSFTCEILEVCLPRHLPCLIPIPFQNWLVLFLSAEKVCVCGGGLLKF